MKMVLPLSLNRTIASLTNTDDALLVFEYMNVQQQDKESDWGLFAIANAVTQWKESCHV